MQRGLAAFIWSVGIACMSAGAVHAGLPECGKADFDGLPQAEFHLAETAPPATTGEDGPILQAWFDAWPRVQYPYGAREDFGFDLALVINLEGRATCYTLDPLVGSPGPALTPQRQAFLSAVESMRFKPAQVENRAAAVWMHDFMYEEELPQVHRDMPQGSAEEAVIVQELDSFRVELHGDGSAVYTSLYPTDDPLGPQAYRVDAKAVQALLSEARAADFWSLRDEYMFPMDPDWEVVKSLAITVGGETKTVRDNGGGGMPWAAERLQGDVWTVADTDFWEKPGLATLEQLRRNGFDFRSEAAGRFLLKLAQNWDVKDETVLAVLDLGAPADARDAENADTTASQFGQAADEGVLEAALRTGKVAVVKRLIDGGVLDIGGRLDKAKVNLAFQSAVHTGNPASVELMLGYGPDMTIPDPGNPQHHISILRALGAWSPEGGRIAVAQRLIDLGADVNAQDPEGRTLLFETRGGDARVIAFLLDHGADANIADHRGVSPLGSAMEQDIALLLLQHGANPRQASATQMLRLYVKRWGWTDVEAWLIAHGYADVLKPQKGDS